MNRFTIIDPSASPKQGPQGILATLGTAFGLSTLLTACPTDGIIGGSNNLSGFGIPDPEISTLPDGIYWAKASAAVSAGSVAAFSCAEAEVTLAGGTYAVVKLTAPSSFVDDPKFLELAANIVVKDKIGVDTVSGATISSKAS